MKTLVDGITIKAQVPYWDGHKVKAIKDSLESMENVSTLYVDNHLFVTFNNLDIETFTIETTANILLQVVSRKIDMFYKDEN
jgi:hypothetical protein